MRPTVQHIYPVVALLLLAGATVWLERTTRGEDARSPALQRLDPDFTAERTRLISYGKDGRQHYELLADRITHYPLSRVTQLERPRLRYDVEGRELRVTALSGEVLDEGEQVRLSGDVHALREATAERPQLTFESASLIVWPQDERAETSDPVKLTQGASSAQASGLKLDNLAGTLELIGNARVHIPRTPRNTP